MAENAQFFYVTKKTQKNEILLFWIFVSFFQLAILYKRELKDDEKAKEYCAQAKEHYEQAIKETPSAIVLCNYGVLLEEFREYDCKKNP